jgi:hypothetical protein
MRDVWYNAGAYPEDRATLGSDPSAAVGERVNRGRAPKWKLQDVLPSNFLYLFICSLSAINPCFVDTRSSRAARTELQSGRYSFGIETFSSLPNC